MKNLLEVLTDCLGKSFAIGGSTALVVAGQLPKDYIPGDLDIVVSSENSVAILSEYLLFRGWEVSLDFPTSRGFGVRKQWKKNGEKLDVFITPSMRKWSFEEDGYLYLKPEVIWAARGYYAGNNAKAYGQLVEHGMIRPHNGKQHKIGIVRKFLYNVGYAMSIIKDGFNRK